MDGCQATDILSLTTTVGSLDDARRLAQGLLEQRLAACVQLEEITESHYRWESRLCADPEVRLTIKSRPQRLAALQAFFAEHHPYDVPQLLWQVLSGSDAYAGWVQGETASG
ncbi:MAG TPA: divalent-cation tolerance protein CutA [Ramlibacter sp.]|nr:divalent-cation tolerance protein CutA [Ramlibacter sp.]